MARFKSYILNEGRGQKIKLEDAVKLVKTKCKKILKKYTNSEDYIYRGLEENNDFYFIDPIKFDERKSKYANENFYTLLLSNLPSWKDYPKRSKSIICSTDIRKAEDYGNLYIVFPYDNSKIGVCPGSDIWYSFKKNIRSLNFFNKDILSIIFLGSDFGEWDYNFKKLNTDWKYFQEILHNSVEEIISQNIDLYDILSLNYDFLLNYLKNPKGTIIDFLNDAMSPQNNDFKLVKSGNSLPISREVWTDGTSILVAIEVISKFMVECM